MQEQQYDTEAVLRKGTLSRVKVERYRVKYDVSFMDGFVIRAGEPVRKVIGSREECGYVNVIYEIERGVKRMVWLRMDNLELESDAEEIRDVSELQKEKMDMNENWFD